MNKQVIVYTQDKEMVLMTDSVVQLGEGKRMHLIANVDHGKFFELIRFERDNCYAWYEQAMGEIRKEHDHFESVYDAMKGMYKFTEEIGEDLNYVLDNEYDAWCVPVALLMSEGNIVLHM